MKHTYSRRLGRQLAVALYLSLCLATVAAGFAQTLTTTLTAEPGFGVAIADMKLERGTVGAEFRVAARPQVAVSFTTPFVFGPIGNVVVEGSGALRLGNTFSGEGRLAARGVLGPVAVRVAAVGYSGAVADFRPAQLASSERPTYSTPAFGVQLGMSYRPSRNLVLDLSPELYFASGLALRVDGSARVLRVLGANELLFVGHSYLTPGLNAASGALGGGLTLTRGRAPDWTFVALVGASPAGVALGGRVTLAEDLGPVRATLEAAYEPYRLDVAPLRLTASAELPAWHGGRWQLSAAATGDALGRYSQPFGSHWHVGLSLITPLN